MQQTVRTAFLVILWIFGLSALLCIVGLAYLWFYPKPPSNNGVQNLPYLGQLLTAIIIEAAAVVFVFVRSGLKYLPEVTIKKKESDTFDFMCSLIGRGTSVTIVSNRLSLLTRSEKFLATVVEKAGQGTRFEFITRIPIEESVRNQLEKLGAQFYVVDGNPPDARFTLINAARVGGETLAIARGTHPAHEITVFDASSGPQMIAMAKDIIRKSKALANVK